MASRATTTPWTRGQKGPEGRELLFDDYMITWLHGSCWLMFINSMLINVDWILFMLVNINVH
jgi:hypothetical protein